MYEFVCDRNAMYDAGKEDYLRPSEHIGLDWIGLDTIRYDRMRYGSGSLTCAEKLKDSQVNLPALCDFLIFFCAIQIHLFTYLLT